MQWFKHQTDAHRDAKLLRLMRKHGLQGYGLYFYLLELIVKRVDEENFTFELEEDAEIISHDVGIHADLLSEMMRDMVRLKLFEDNAGGVITCLKVSRMLQQSQTSNPRMRALIAGISGDNPAKPLPPSKTRKSPPRASRAFVPPSVAQVEGYCEKRRAEGKPNSVDASKFVDFYESKGWMVGKNKMKSWEAAVRTWERPSNTGTSSGNNDYDWGQVE